MNWLDARGPRTAAGVLTAGLVVAAVFRWRSRSAGAVIAALVAGTAIAVACVALDRRLKQTGTTFAAAEHVINPADARATAVLRRYEVVVLSLAGIIVATHIAGGSFRAPKPISVADTTTLETSQQPHAQVFTPPTHPVDPFVAAPFAVPGLSPSVAETYPELTTAPPPPTFADSGSFGEVLPFVDLKIAPGAIAVGSTGDAWVAGATSPMLVHVGPAGSVLDTFRVGDTQGGFAGVILGAKGDLVLLATSPPAVIRFNPASQATTAYATIPDVAVPCSTSLLIADCDPSTVNQPPMPTAFVFDAKGRLYVADAGQGTVWRIPAGGGKATTFIARQDWTNALRPAGPTGLALDRAGDLIVSVQATLSDDSGLLFRQKFKADGSAGTLSQLATTGAASRPGVVAVANDGRVFVILRGTGRVLAVSSDAKEQRLIPAAPSPALTNPTALAFRGQSLLTATQGPNAESGRIVRLPVGTTGAPLYLS